MSLQHVRMSENVVSRQCTIPRELLLDMVREEARIRQSDRFQAEIAREQADNITDGTWAIVKMQVRGSTRVKKGLFAGPLLLKPGTLEKDDGLTDRKPRYDKECCP